MMAAERMGGAITEEQAEQVISEADTVPKCRKADALGRYLRLSDETRTSLVQLSESSGTHFELESDPSHFPRGFAGPIGQWSQNFRCPVLGACLRNMSEH